MEFEVIMTYNPFNISARQPVHITIFVHIDARMTAAHSIFCSEKFFGWQFENLKILNFH